MSSDEHLETLNMTSVRGLLQLHIYPHVNTVYPHITYLPPANEVCGKVIFSVACVKNSVHGKGGVPRHVPPGQVHPQVCTPGRYTPQVGTPWQVHPLGRYTPWQVHLPWAGTPPRQVHPPGQVHPPEQYMLGDTGNKRAVRILLECILVSESI